MKRDFVKEEKGAITTLVLFTVLMFAVILMGVYLSITTMQKGQLKSDMRIRDLYGENVGKVDKVYNELINRVEYFKLSGEYASENKTLIDKFGNNIVIPEGFKIASDSGITVPEGIVIEDDDVTTDGNGEQRGNQYVWVPVSSIDNSNIKPIIKDENMQEFNITLGRYDFDSEGKEELYQLGNSVLLEEEPVKINDYFQELYEYREGIVASDNTGKNATALNLVGFIESVRDNGGYYIARYEASYGLDGKPNSKVSNSCSSNPPTEEGELWNDVNQVEAAKVCRNIYREGNCKTDLINSFAWDTAVLYIQKCSDATTYSRAYSNNLGGLSNTGKNGDEYCKINDMASNVSEWTTENSIGTFYEKLVPATFRGGNYWSKNYYTTKRDYANITQTNDNLSGFRLILYL